SDRFFSDSGNSVIGSAPGWRTAEGRGRPPSLSGWRRPASPRGRTAMSANEESVFGEALEIRDLQQRADFLDRACAGDPGLRRSVESRLSAYGAARFLGAPAPAPVLTVDDPAVAERPGSVLGPYKLLEQIGEGGFGVVFMAEQTHPVRRKVALKV